MDGTERRECGSNSEVHDIEELIQSIDIVEYISQFVELEQRGEEWWGLSCFKRENTPSFSVRREPPFFYDYSSGKGGNLYNFIMLYKRCSAREAIEEMKRYAGIDNDVVFVPKEKMAATIDCKKFMRKKQNTKQSKSTILPDDYMERYTVDEEKLAAWEREGISPETLRDFQVRYDPFSDRLVYPIRNVQGKIVNVGGRTLDPEWKEKKLRKYCYFYPWGTMDTIYGLAENIEEIARKKEIILFEGCKSVLIAYTWGIKNAGAVLTSHLNGNQMNVLAKLGCRVVFALDKDVDILQDKNIRRLKQFVNVWYLYDEENLLDDKDAPVDKGADVFRKLYSARRKYR